MRFRLRKKHRTPLRRRRLFRVHILDRLNPFKGTAVDGLIHSWLGIPTYQLPGVPVGVTVDRNNAPVAVDPTLLKELLGELEVKDIGIIAEQGYGKTFFVSLWLYIMSALDVGTGGYLRFRYNSLKRNGRGRPESAPLIEDLMGCTIISASKMQLNPLSRRWDMLFDEKYVMLTRIYQYITGGKLTLEMQKVLKACLRVVESDTTEDPSFPALQKALGAYDPSYGDTPCEGLSERKLKQRERDYDRLEDAASQLNLATDVFNEGEFASLFTGTGEEMIELLAQRAVSFDLKDMTPRTRSVIEIILSAITRAAALPWPDDPEMKPRHPEWLVDVIVVDEAYSDWENPEAVEEMYIRMKTQRESGTIGVTIFHRLRDFLEAIGNNVNGHKARNAINEIKIWFIGRQNEDALNDIRNFLRLPEYVVQSLPYMLKGHFWLIIPGLPPIKIAIIGTKETLNAFNTDAANNALLRRYLDTNSVNPYLQYLQETTPKDSDTPLNQGGNVHNEAATTPAT